VDSELIPNIARDYVWRRPDEAGDLLKISRTRSPRQEQHLVDPRCSAAFGPPFVDCCDSEIFAFLSVDAWAVQMLKNWSVSMDDADSSIVVALMRCEEVGWDYVWRPHVQGDDCAFSVGLRDLQRAAARGTPTDFLAPEKHPKRAKTSHHASSTPFCDLETLLEELINDEEREHVASIRSAHASMDGEPDVDSASSDASDRSAGRDLEVGIGDASDHITEDSASDVVDGGSDLEDILVDDPPPVDPPKSREDVLAQRLLALGESRAVGFKDYVCDEYGVSLKGMFLHDEFVDGDKAATVVVGKIQLCFGGTTLCATCSLHPRCKFLLSQKLEMGLSLLHVEADLISWLAKGTVQGEDAHYASMVRVKRDFYKMKVK
jgi:hypothetical protein